MTHTLSLFSAVVLAAIGCVSAAPTISALKTTADSRAQVAKRGESYSGTATYFIPETEGGTTGACGPSESSSSHIVALNAPQYGSMSKKSSWCGKQIRITGQEGTVTAKINDACPECGYGSLDLTPVLFEQVVGDESIGEGKISWTVI